MISLPFTKVDGNGLSLNDLVFSNGKAAAMSGSADQIKLWVKGEDGTYDYQTWYHHNTDGWKGLSDDVKSQLFDNVYPLGLPSGSVFWYIANKRATAGTVQTSGAVDADLAVTKTITRGSYNFVGYPYPTPLMLDDTDMVDWGTAVKSAMSGSADQIKMWLYDEALGEYNYETWYIKSSGWTGLSDSVKGMTFKQAHPNGVTVGTGFWYIAKTKSGSETFDITFKSPLAKAAK